MDKFKISLIGRTNVGKSTLFNRLSRTRDALIFDRPGVTRDIREKGIEIWDKKATLLDTPGMFDYSEGDNKPELMDAINSKLNDIIKSSDLIIFVMDGIIGVTPNDLEISKTLRKSGKNVIVAVNKSEKKSTEDAYSLGFHDTVMISAEHGIGIDVLMELMHDYIPKQEEIFEESQNNEEEVIKLAIIGRPNVGKSTMVNSILGENKQLVADFSGLTRESLSYDFEYNGRKFKIIDTPGIRRKSRISEILEKISASNSKNSYKKADAVILIIDATSLESGEIEKQDFYLAANIIDEGKPLVIAFNKYDKTPYKKDDVPKFLKRSFSKNLSQLKDVPFLFVSAINEENIEKMLDTAILTYDKHKKKLKTSDLNNWLKEINEGTLLQSSSAKFKLKYITQIGVSPPVFLIFVSHKKNMRIDHERHIINNLKQYFRLDNISIKIVFKDQTKTRKQ